MSSPKPKIRYAVVGLGYISQTAVLPAFANASENSELAALSMRSISPYPTACTGSTPNVPHARTRTCFAKSPWLLRKRIARP